MPVPSSNTRGNIDRITGACGNIKTNTVQARTRFQSSGGNADQVLSIQQQYKTYKDQLTQLSSPADLDTVAREVLSNYTGSLTADVAATNNAMQVCVDWISTNIPKDASGYLLIYTMDANYNRVPRAFSAGALGGLISNMQAVEATIS